MLNVVANWKERRVMAPTVRRGVLFVSPERSLPLFGLLTESSSLPPILHSYS